MSNFMIITNSPPTNENGIATVNLSKQPQTLTQVTAIRGDNKTQIIEMYLPRYHGGVDMSNLSYMVNVINANGDGDVFQLQSPDVTETFVKLVWLVQGIATAVKSITKFEVEGIRQDENDAVVWQSGSISFLVTDDLGNIPTQEQEQHLSNLQTLILYVDQQLPAILQQAEEAAQAEEQRKEAEVERDEAEKRREDSFLTFSYGFEVVNGVLCVKFADQEEGTAQDEQ